MMCVLEAVWTEWQLPCAAGRQVRRMQALLPPDARATRQLRSPRPTLASHPLRLMFCGSTRIVSRHFLR